MRERRGAVCRELTKTYEEVVRGPLADLAAWADAGEVRGEITLVVEGAPAAAAASVPELVPQVQQRAADGLRLKDAVAEVASAHGVSKRELYDAVLAARSRA